MAHTLLSRVLAPALAVALLGGCVSDYAYRSDGGGYYYGRPSVEYRYYGGYGYPYGYGGYGYGYRPYGYPYGYHYRPYYPGYPYYPYRPPYHRPPYKPPHRHDDDRGKPPWRDLDRISREHRDRNEPRPRIVPRGDLTRPAPPMSRPLPPNRSSGPRPVPQRVAPPSVNQPPRVHAPRPAPPVSRPAPSRSSGPRVQRIGTEREL
ncbi:hypothetical protein [Marilutibacter chinensis]|uniref:Lipoprotein n=1 Tax=Marilutibacter chinensis TaxID=2912247 RepID=A0ABS9HS35_9GAMM|nr:hypothetical protein [Lysobacter chinensis]MCF7221740.1 hypothetical protein [Lysobacter chinensis]